MSSDVEQDRPGRDDRRRRQPTVHASERESRAVAEAARESDWERPSFAKGLYLGHFDLDLVHPHPRATPEDEARGEEFLARLREVCDRRSTAPGSSARRRSRTRTSPGSPTSARSA